MWNKCLYLAFLSCYLVLAGKTPCGLQGVDYGNLNKRMVTIYSVRFPWDGLAANWAFNVVRHNPCPGEGVCKWIFHACRGNEFVLENKHYRGKFLYANVVNSVSYFKVSIKQACDQKKYTWKVFYDSCSSNYYLQNAHYGDWLDASDTGLVKHAKCKVNEMFAWDSCGNWRRWNFQDITDKY